MNDFKKYSINLRGRLVDIDKPLVMGIINATPDSFYSDSRMLDAHDIACKANEMAQQGADIIDIGPALLSMHSPLEIASKADFLALKECYRVFFNGMNSV